MFRDFFRRKKPKPHTIVTTGSYPKAVSVFNSIVNKVKDDIPLLPDRLDDVEYVEDVIQYTLCRAGVSNLILSTCFIPTYIGCSGYCVGYHIYVGNDGKEYDLVTFVKCGLWFGLFDTTTGQELQLERVL